MAPPAPDAPPAPTRVFAGAKLFIEDTGEFGTALSASFIEKKVPVVVVFAYNVKKGNFQDAANSTANELKNKGIAR